MSKETQTVAVDLNKDGEFEMCDLIATKGGWSEVRDQMGKHHKVRNSQVAMNDDEDAIEDLMTDDDDDQDSERGDVFPAGIRETYQVGTTEDGAKFIDCGDTIAVRLRGASLEEVAAMAAEIVKEPRLTKQGWLDLYNQDRIDAGKDALNVGMRRMNIGNRIRAALKRKAEDEAAEAKAA